MASCQHKHILALKGVHTSNDDMFLIYEYMANGSLEDHLYLSQSKRSELLVNNVILDWPQRLRIALGTASGLLYLHEVSGLIIGRPKNRMLEGFFSSLYPNQP
jgi:serine/threonine protein kinase